MLTARSIAWIVRLLLPAAALCILGCAHHGVAPVDFDDVGRDPLAVAVLMREYETATRLLDHGYPVRGKSVQPNEAAYWAITGNDIQALRLLLRHGLDVNCDWGETGGTLLTNAVQLGHIEIVRLLCDAGASTNRDPKFGGTPLYAAIIYDQKEIEQYLRGRGARLNEWDLNALRVLGLPVK